MLAIYQPLSPVVAIPSTKYFWKNKKIKKQGIKDRQDIANMAPQFVTDEGSENDFNAIDTVYNSGFCKYNNGPMKSSHFQQKEKTVVVTIAGNAEGTIICKNIRNLPHPSIDADSSNSRGIPCINCIIKKIKNGKPAYEGIINGLYELIQLNFINKIY